MKKLTNYLMKVGMCLLGSVAFVACGDDDPDDSPAVEGLTVTPTSLSFTKDGGQKSIIARAGQDVTA